MSLAGNYNLVSLAFGAAPAPGSTGTLAFTSDSFNAVIRIISPDTAFLHDTTLTLGGAYVAKHTSAADSVFLVLLGLGTIPGTFQISGTARDTLELDLLSPLGPLSTTWLKL